MKIDGVAIKRLREQKAWSQEHLASVSGLSLRTIQRIEAEGAAMPETRMAVAAALGISASELTSTQTSRTPLSLPHKLGLACGLAGAVAGLAFGWNGVLSDAASGLDSGMGYGIMSTLTGITCALIGVIANRTRLRA